MGQKTGRSERILKLKVKNHSHEFLLLHAPQGRQRTALWMHSKLSCTLPAMTARRDGDSLD